MGSPAKKPHLGWTWISAIILVLLFADLCALTWYLWAIPEAQLEHSKKIVTAVAGWISSVLGFFGIKYAVRKRFPLSQALRLLPVRLSTIALTLGIWFFVLPFHSITLYVQGPDNKPLAGVTPTVDGVRQLNPSDDRGQLKIKGLAAWTHRIILEKEGYKTKEGSAGFADVLAVKNLPAQKLEEAEGTVAVHTIPPGAEIYVDGSSDTIGSAESFSLPRGKHRIILKMPGFETWTEEILVSAGKQVELPVRKLRPLKVPTYQLLVDSIPVGAAVYVDGIFQGTTRETIFLPRGQHKIELRKPGYRSTQATVLIPNQTMFAPQEPLQILADGQRP